MALFEWTIPLLVVCVALAALARRLSLPYPSLLAVAGAGIAFLPFAQPVEIEPDLALALFVAPVLLDGAFNTSPRDLNRHLVPLTMLALAAVLVTAAAVAFVGWKWFGIPLAAAVALGAIVAPPDAVAASAVLDDLHLPRRLLTILQGESLWNDATALYLYRIAILWAGGSLVLTTAVPLLLLAAVASVAVGYGLARLYLFATIRVRDPASVIVLQFVGTFGVWILSERLGLSAIVTVVVYAMTIARLASGRMSARLRISSYSVWETAFFVLNVLAFLFMGLQALPILQRLADESLPQAAALSAATLATVIVVRLLWVLLTSYATRGLAGKRSKLARESNVRSDLVIGWCGMRGIVTLAAAFGLPGNFPARDMIVLAAFG